MVTTANYDRNADHPDWDPDWEHGFFHGVLFCGRPICREKVVVSGEYRVQWDGVDSVWPSLRLRFAIPAIPLITPPGRVPQAVLDYLESANCAIWAEPSASANALRRCVEAVLDDQRINKTVRDKNGKRVRLSTHNRIVVLKVKKADAALHLEAVKWLWNRGSHSSLTTVDCIESAEQLERALRILYDTKDADLARKAHEINLSKGRRNPRTKV